jgi:hypothetical protein
MKKYILTFALLLITFSAANAQNRSAAYSEIKVSLVRGLTMQAATNTLDFGEIFVKPVSQQNFINQENGLKYLATGHPNRNATVTYDNSVTLTNSSWVASNGGQQGSILFTTATAQQTGNSPEYQNPSNLTSGSTATMVNDGGTGKLYMWLGGKLDVPADQPHGVYSGTFNISIAY